jgi:hypothetical protein
MCYMVYISTDSPKDFAECNSELILFESVTGPESDPCISVLEFPLKWLVRSKSGCSCSFRHLYISSVALGFSEPEDWYKEEKDELDATRELYRVLNDILVSGYKIDLVDRWEGAEPEDITTLDVSLDEVTESAFRMFEDHKFRLKKNNTQTLRP